MLNEQTINDFLRRLSTNLVSSKVEIFKANEQDIKTAKEKGKDDAFIERLTVSEKTLVSMLTSLEEVARQPFPVGKVVKEWDVPHNGLHIKRITCPIGKILIIYESRPNVTLDAFALCFKAGNACILRGGGESFMTSSKIAEIIHKTFDDMGLSQYKNLMEYVQTTDRQAIADLLKKHDEIDLVIPRGGRGLVEFVAQNTAIPILKHLDGNCHTYIENSADPAKAITVLHNAKLRRVSVCGATETLVVDKEFAQKHLSHIVEIMQGCEFVGCEQSRKIDGSIKPATEADFYTEFLAPKLTVKVVSGVGEAVEFINKHSSKHTEAILSENPKAVQKFFEEVDSANIIHNASTQFADGYEFGIGAEIGIATGKIHARGPVGLQELVTYKNIVEAKDYTIRP